jgi:hypothetical protein
MNTKKEIIATLLRAKRPDLANAVAKEIVVASEASKYLKTFFEEKNLPEVEWELKDRSGQTHWISNEVVIEHILIAPEHEKKGLADMIRKLDFKNANINDYLKHLAGALINAHAAKAASPASSIHKAKMEVEKLIAEVEKTGTALKNLLKMWHDADHAISEARQSSPEMAGELKVATTDMADVQKSINEAHDYLVWDGGALDKLKEVRLQVS